MSLLNPESIKYLVVHCSATPPNIDVGVKEIDQWHRDKGWIEIGYHLVIRRVEGPYGGLIEYGTRTFMKKGAHVGVWNSFSLGICMVGGVDSEGKPENNFTEDQFKALYKTIKFLNGIFPKAKIVGHRDFEGVSKACPCFDVQGWWARAEHTPKQTIPKLVLPISFEG